MAKGFKTGGGSRAGVPNKVPSAVKDMILGALDAKGGQAWLEQQAELNPTAFMSLLGRIIPAEMKQVGDDGKAVDARPSFVWVVQK